MDVRAKLIELLDDIFSTDIPTPTEAIADMLIEDGVTAPRWIPAKEKQREFEQYLCVVLRPIPGGSYVRELRVLWSDYGNRWICEDLIVTHWMPLPELPKEES